MRDFVVLAATDFSGGSFEMLSKADKLARDMGAKLYIAHIIEDSFFGEVDNIEEVRSRCITSLTTEMPDIKFEDFYCKKGNVKDEISKLTKELDASIVIIGGEGENSVIEELFIGSNTKDIIRGSIAPVLIAKSKAEPLYKRILIPTDFSDESRIAIKKAAGMFVDASLILLNVYSIPFESRLGGYYGFSHDAIEDFQNNIKSDIQKKGDEFLKTIDLPLERLELRIMRGSMNHKLFMELISPIRIDLVCLHTTGVYSFFAFDILESSTLDVLMYKI